MIKLLFGQTELRKFLPAKVVLFLGF